MLRLTSYDNRPVGECGVLDKTGYRQDINIDRSTKMQTNKIQPSVTR